MADKTLKLNPTQLAVLRNCVLRDLQQDAEHLIEHIQEAHKGGDDKTLVGEDARTTYYLVVQNAELLDLIGWSVDGDVSLLNGDILRRRDA